MDTKIEKKEEDPLSDDVSSHNETELFSNTNRDCYTTVKLENNSEPPFLELCLQEEEEKNKHLKQQIKHETFGHNSNCVMNIKTEPEEEILVPDFVSQSEREFLEENPVRKANESVSDYEIVNKIEVKEEPCWLKTETSSLCNELKDADFPPVNSPRSCIEMPSSESSLPSAEDMRQDLSLCTGKHIAANGFLKISNGQLSNDTEKHFVERNIHSEPNEYSNVGRTYRKDLHLKQKNVFLEVNRHKCEICDKKFTRLSNLKAHNLIHEGKKPHKCEICDKRFTQLSHLKSHNLIHEGKKPHKCEVCDKRFTRLSHLKSHNLIHEGKKPHKCSICEKRFTELTSMKRHILIHEGKKPHKCEICEKSFSQMSHLKKHNLIHGSKNQNSC